MSLSKAVREHLREFLRLFTSYYPFFSGCGTIAQTGSLSSLLKGEKEPKVVHLKSGEFILVLLDDYVGGAVYYFGDWISKVSWICRGILLPATPQLI